MDEQAKVKDSFVERLIAKLPTPFEEYRTIGRRMYAALFDLLSLAGLEIVSGFLFRSKDVSLAFLVHNYLPVALFICYSTVATKFFGGTLGKVLFRLRVVKSGSESRIGWLNSMGRSLPYIFLFLGQVIPFIVNSIVPIDVDGDLSLHNLLFVQLTVFLNITWVYIVIGPIVMFLSVKRRALHDFVGFTVVKIEGDYRKWTRIGVAVLMGLLFVAYWRPN